MGHIRLPILSQTRRWRDVVAFLSAGAGVDVVAASTAHAAERALKSAVNDPLFLEAVNFLIKIPIAARCPDFDLAMSELGIVASNDIGPLDLSVSISTALDARVPTVDRSDFGEMAHMALIESLSSVVQGALPTLFEPKPGEVRTVLGRLASGDRFADLAQTFFSRLTHRTLDYYLAREMANHVGEGAVFADDAARRHYDRALAEHCHEAAFIVKAYSGGWFGKTVFHGDGPTPDAIRRYAAYAFTKIRAELGKRRIAA